MILKSKLEFYDKVTGEKLDVAIAELERDIVWVNHPEKHKVYPVEADKVSMRAI